MEIPKKVQYILRRLRAGGHAAYAVGGCVRDALLGRTPKDWDICTAALPEETERCFSHLRVVETGLRHGTVTVLLEGQSFEITTFRRDGAYADHRRPDQVVFVPELWEDLARRDFTVNAMAVGENGLVIDLFGGQEDLAVRHIRCVGDPDQRFQEDALRILRGLRFASELEFDVEPETAAAMERNQALLGFVSGERVYAELTKLLVGPGASGVLEQYGQVLRAVLPEIGPAMGFLQRHPCHDRDVWGHTLEALGRSRPDPVVRWALLLHDLGKPDCFTVDDWGIGHFYGHPRRSEELARQIFERLHADSATREAVCTLVRRHDEGAPADRRVVRRWIGRLGPDLLRKLLEVKQADGLAHADTPKARARYEAVLEFAALTDRVLEEEQCFTVRDLQISGRDVLAAGVQPGPQVGRMLQRLLEEVLEERCVNTKTALKQRMKEILCAFPQDEKGQYDAD